MTTTNNSAKYAVSLDYEVREADNSINCKNAYEVFDNMQDAVNYAIDFIANNPDANFCLTNEHFSGSHISVYGDSPTKDYDLTDADINAVRNVEVNEADVEDYAVTEEAQDVDTNSEIRNANTASGNYSETIYTDVRNGRKIFESVTYKNHSIVRVESPRYGLTLDITFKGNKVFKHNGRRIAAKAATEVYMNRERADEQYKIFSAYFANIPDNRGCFEVLAHLTYADGQEHKYMFEFNQTKQVEQFKQEVQSFAADNNTPCQIYVKIRPYKSNVTAWVDPHQYGEPGNLEQPRDISVYCNEPAANVTADEDTVFAAYEAAINGDRAYVLKAQELFTAHADGDTLRSFQLAYAQDRKQYGENISQALRALGDNRSEGYNEKLQSLIDTWDAESDKVLTVNKTIFKQRLIEALIQKFDERREHVNEPATPTVAELEAEIAEPVNPERFSATVYYYRPDENGGEPWHGDKYQQFATAADAANFIIKFAAEHYDYTITTDSNIRDWDNRKQYWLTDADINALDADAFVKTTRQAAALKDKISRDAKASDDDNTFDLIPGIDEFNDIESEWDYWAGIEKQIDYEFGNFTARIGNATVTFRDNHIVKICEDNLIYTKVNGRRQFRISGRLVSRKEFEEFVLIGTDNQPEPPAVNDDEDKIFTFEVGKTYYGDDFDGVWTTDCKVIIHTLTVISRTAKTLTAVDEAGNTVTKKIVLGYSGTRESVNVLGVNDTTVQTVTISANHEYTPAIAAVSTEHYLDWMNAVENIELGLPIPDETPATPTVAELEAEIADNLRSIDEAYTELEAIEAEVGDEDCLTPQEHIDYLNDFIAECRERVNECREQIDSIKAEGEYAQAAAATDRIRKIDPDAEIIFAADEPTTERFILTTADNSCANCATAAEAEDLFYQLQADKPAPTVKPAARFELPYCIKFPNGEELWSLDGKWNHVTSDKYGADIYRNGIDDSREFVIRYSDDDKRWATAEEFFAEMVKRGACEIDEPPTDPLTAAQAEYDAAHAASIAATQAVIDADNALRHAKELERQAAERESAAFFKLGNLKREITDTVDRLNAAAPEDWSVVPDPDNKKFFVKAGGKSVAEIDSLALAKVLPPDKFFARFTPLTDDEPNQRYADQLYQEYLELLDMRDNLPDDPERLKVIDGLIRDLEREMLAARLDLPTSTPTTAC